MCPMYWRHSHFQKPIHISSVGNINSRGVNIIVQNQTEEASTYFSQNLGHSQMRGIRTFNDDLAVVSEDRLIREIKS